MTKLLDSENFAKERNSSVLRKDGDTTHYEHLTGVVTRLKNLGVSDEDVLCAAWLHDIIEDTNTSFHDIDQRFGSRVAVLVLSLSKDKTLPKGQQEEQYVKQLRESSFEAKLIKLCAISANLKDIKGSSLSKTKKTKTIRKILHYLDVIKPDLVKNKASTPAITSLIDGINAVAVSFGHRPVSL
ncbi:MAG: guanosine polyphosphate pyrophosphohydrolase [Thaumarchaeota archaeon 13_1_20CM_2_39_11]|nr:MAG: guanosine polyphosphate pyrophosphohydrolase [Thaumarchaeota archaeon 13_1_40CM_2_39_13_1]OLE44084.1 MAG: guanosine polyphosphate pyrophosphohydrolase [Thaumarchaeota archaeon 13_1_20CM_2_39_11]